MRNYQDELGSTSHVASSSGQLLEYYKYDLYGKPTYFSSTSQPLNSSTYGVKDLFTGQRWVPELGLYDDRNRFMSPELGRFLQPDPIGFKGDSSNLYRYCGNDWANRSDPMGLVTGDPHADLANMQKEQQRQQRDPINVQTIQIRNPQENMKGFTMGGSHQMSNQNLSFGQEQIRSANANGTEARHIAQAVAKALDTLKDCKGDCASNIREYNEHFAQVINRNKIDTSNWKRVWTTHPVGKNALESPTIPGHPDFAVKLYNRPKDGIAVVHPTDTPIHDRETIQYYIFGVHVNAINAERFLGEQ